jgi:hypothetical protein
MSGGRYDYAYEKINDLADAIRPDTALRKAFKEHLRKVSDACQAIEWVDSGDSSWPHDDDAIRKALGDMAILLALNEAAKDAARVRDELNRALADANNALSKTITSPPPTSQVAPTK